MFQYTAAQGWWQTVVPILYGREQCSKTHKFGPAVRQHYLLHYVLDGEGFLHKGGQVYSVSKGDLFVILPGEVTTYWADQIHPWQYAWVGFYINGGSAKKALPQFTEKGFAPVIKRGLASNYMIK